MAMEEEEEQQGAALRKAGQKAMNMRRVSSTMGKKLSERSSRDSAASPRLARLSSPDLQDESPLSTRGSRNGRISFAADQLPGSSHGAEAEWGRLRAAALPPLE